MVLRETVRQTDNDPKAFNRADYFNVLVGLISLKEPEAHIRLAWQKFIASEGSCEYLTSTSFKEFSLKKTTPAYIREAWVKEATSCLSNGFNPATSPDPETYAVENSLDIELVKLIAQIGQDDQRFRKGLYQPEQQTPLDRKNERLINQLYEQYGSYLGTSLVGEAYSSVMWSIIQHSRPATMERYLPVIHKAVKAGELPEGPLRMLIDRVQTHKTGKQVFGSQVGVPLLPESTRAKIADRYAID